MAQRNRPGSHSGPATLRPCYGLAADHQGIYLFRQKEPGWIVSVSECEASVASLGFSPGRSASSQRKTYVAATAPAICAQTNGSTSTGRIPANVSLKARATVTAGLANDVDDVNQ